MILICAVIVVAAIAMAVRSNEEAKKLRQQISELEQQNQQQGQAKPEEVKRLVEEVNKLIALPEGEEPSVATISDKDKLGDVAFFAKADNGDKILIYTQARRAYLYRPSENRILEVATLNLTASPSPTTSPRPTAAATSPAP